MYTKSIRRELRNKKTIIRNIFRYLIAYFKIPIRKNQFNYQSTSFPYFIHYYNKTWTNERAVEIPIAKHWYQQYKSKNILEIGNVLSHYMKLNHTVVDKYDIRPSSYIIGQDIVEYISPTLYDLILSISTFEHIGFDENPQEPEKLTNAFVKVRSLLNQEGVAIITVPVNYNPYLDKYIKDNYSQFSAVTCFKRISKANEWKQIEFAKIFNCKYGSPFPKVNGIMILELKKTK
ncbi:hypothetical protein JW935_20985 [candidate division KSB1 bacterium]|nr:hypothetical protein [candidate division KSB1 bacterium]